MRLTSGRKKSHRDALEGWEALSKAGGHYVTAGAAPGQRPAVRDGQVPGAGETNPLRVPSRGSGGGQSVNSVLGTGTPHSPSPWRPQGPFRVCEVKTSCVVHSEVIAFFTG